MNNTLQTFTDSEFGSVRTIIINEEPWFVGKDVAEILGYENQNRDIIRHIDEEDRFMFDGKTQYQNGIELGQRGGWLINESGLYSLILSSKLPSAKKFKRWITSEVIPAIRKHGGYLTDSKIKDILDDPDTIIELATKLKEERLKNQQLAAENSQMKPKALFADAVTASSDTILIRDLAKLIKQNGIDIGEKKLYQWLRENGYLIRGNSMDHNMPTQRSMELKLFEIHERTINYPDQAPLITKTVKVTGKGQKYFINKFMTA